MINEIAYILAAYLLGATGERVVARLRTDLFSHLLDLSPGFHTHSPSGETKIIEREVGSSPPATGGFTKSVPSSAMASA